MTSGQKKSAKLNMEQLSMRKAFKNSDQLTQVIKMTMVELVGEDTIKIF